MIEQTQLPPPGPAVHYVPAVVNSSTCVAKTILMLTIISNGIAALIYVAFLFTLIVDHKVGTDSLVMGCFILLAWFGGWLWLAIVGYRGILQVRRECLEAKLNHR